MPISNWSFSFWDQFNFFYYSGQFWRVKNFFPSQSEAEKLVGSDKKNFLVISKEKFFTAETKKAISLHYIDYALTFASFV